MALHQQRIPYAEKVPFGVMVEVPAAAECIDHILAGSDYPHQIGSIPLMLGAIRGLPLSDEEKGAILGENARRLLES